MASVPTIVSSSLSAPKFHAGRFWTIRALSFAAVCLLLFCFHTFVTPKLGIYDVRLIVLSLLFATLATSLNLINGVTGQFSIGHAAFYLIGAVSSGKLTKLFFEPQNQHHILWLVLMVLAGGLFAGAAGLLVGLPSLRLRGDYLAVATLGFGEIVNVIQRNQDGGPQAITAAIIVGLGAAILVGSGLIWLQRRFLPNPQGLAKGGAVLAGFVVLYYGTALVKGVLWSLLNAVHIPLNPDSKLDLGGAYGLQSVPKITEIWCIIALFIFTLAIVRNLLKSAHGLSFLSVREDELAADATGVSTTKVKVTAFVVGAALAGMAGALYAHYNGSVSPEDFKMDVSFILVAMVVIGGTGSITGAAIAGISMKLLEEGLRKISRIPALEMFGFILAAILVFILFQALSKRRIIQYSGQQNSVWSVFGYIVCVGLGWIGYKIVGFDLSWVLKIAAWTMLGAVLATLLLSPASKTALPRIGTLGVSLAISFFAAPFVANIFHGIGSVEKLLGETVYSASDLRWAVFSIALVFVMILKPTGILGHHEFSWSFVKAFFTGRMGKVEA